MASHDIKESRLFIDSGSTKGELTEFTFYKADQSFYMRKPVSIHFRVEYQVPGRHHWRILVQVIIKRWLRVYIFKVLRPVIVAHGVCHHPVPGSSAGYTIGSCITPAISNQLIQEGNRANNICTVIIA